MLSLDAHQSRLVGPDGSLAFPDHDEVVGKLAMLIAGECLGLGPTQAAAAFGYSVQRYFQLRLAFARAGTCALVNQPTGPARNYRRTDEALRQVVRQRFFDPQASAEVIAQKLGQTDLTISARSVQRIISYFGLQKKTCIAAAREHRPPWKRVRDGSSPSASPVTP